MGTAPLSGEASQSSLATITLIGTRTSFAALTDDGIVSSGAASTSVLIRGSFCGAQQEAARARRVRVAADVLHVEQLVKLATLVQLLALHV